MRLCLSGCFAALVLALCAGAALAQSRTLETVKSRAVLHCGVNTGIAGFCPITSVAL